MQKKVLILTTSSRPGSNSSYAARIFQQLLATSCPNCQVQSMDLSTAKINYYMEPTTDSNAPSNAATADDFLKFIEPFLAADIVVTFAPIYWSRLPGCFLNFQDRWSEARQIPALDFCKKMQAKVLSFVLVSGADPAAIGYKDALWQVLSSIENYPFIKGIKVIQGPWFIARKNFELEQQQSSAVTAELQALLAKLI